MSAAPNLRRRALMRGVSGAGLLAAGGAACQSIATSDDPWQRAQAIVDRFAAPLVFRDEDFPITAYGAKSATLVRISGKLTDETAGKLDTPAPGSHDCYSAIAAAIGACHKAGGGRVLVPAGNWYCAGPIVLLSNVHVHLAAGTSSSAPNRPTMPSTANTTAAPTASWCCRAGRATTA
jgi:polygalacturonase